MGKDSKIEWCHHTFNPWWGCVKVSPACTRCYAESFAKRVGQKVWGATSPRRFLSDGNWAEPLVWDRLAAEAGARHRVFCGSMCDVMEDRFDLKAPRTRLFNLIADTPNLDWLLLTKRPENFRKFLPWGDAPISHAWRNVWGMTTIESSDYLDRWEELSRVSFVVKGLSMEPLLGPVDLPKSFLELGLRAWCIVGGETGSNPRMTQAVWARTLRDQCAAYGVPFLFKQWGDVLPDTQNSRLVGIGPSSAGIRVGRARAGRLLDGKFYDGFPVGAVE